MKLIYFSGKYDSLYTVTVTIKVDKKTVNVLLWAGLLHNGK